MRVRLDAKTLKTAKRKKIHSMAMAYKTEFEHVRRRGAKNKKPWMKSNYTTSSTSSISRWR